MIPRPSAGERARAADCRGRQIAGLLLLGGLVLGLSLLRASWHDLFPTGWWRW